LGIPAESFEPLLRLAEAKLARYSDSIRLRLRLVDQPAELVGPMQVKVRYGATANRSTEHSHLVAEDGVLQLKLRLAPAAGKHADETDEYEVNEQSQGARMLVRVHNLVRLIIDAGR
jgi:hypothetical protein